MHLTFNPAAVRRQLLQMTNQGQAAFGAACCERLFPLYVAANVAGGCKSPEPLRELLDAVWTRAMGGVVYDFAELVARAIPCVPDEDVGSSLTGALAQDAALAVLAAAEGCVSGGEPTTWRCAQYATDAVDLYIQESLAMDPQDPNLESRIARHELMQRELWRQQRDLAAIEGADFGALREMAGNETVI